jgi:RNA polymerase sigma factor (sigma-70 family)
MAFKEMSDEELMRRLQSGDSSALFELYERHSDKIWSYLKKRVPRAQLEDLFQDCFVKIVEKKDNWEDQPFVLWLYVIIRNIVIDFYRNTKLEQKVMNKFFLDADLPLDRKFEDIISNLPPDVSKLLTEYFQEGWSYKELAERYDVSEVSLRKRLSRALGLLKKGGSDDR